MHKKIYNKINYYNYLNDIIFLLKLFNNLNDFKIFTLLKINITLKLL